MPGLFARLCILLARLPGMFVQMPRLFARLPCLLVFLPCLFARLTFNVPVWSVYMSTCLHV